MSDLECVNITLRYVQFFVEDKCSVSLFRFEISLLCGVSVIGGTSDTSGRGGVWTVFETDRHTLSGVHALNHALARCEAGP